MAREWLADVTFRDPEFFEVDGKRKLVTVLCRDQVKLQIDRDQGILFIGDSEYSIHSNLIKRWRGIHVAGGETTKKKAGK